MKLPSRISFLRRASSMQALLRRPTTRIQNQEPLQSPTPHSPILRLPNELLALILEFLQGDLELYGDSPFYKWLRTSLVCRTWHETILNSPTLWSYIQIFSYRQAEIMFERSRSAVIDVMLQITLPEDYSDPTPTDIMLSRLISDNIHRTRTLRLYGPLVNQFLSVAHPSSATHLLKTLSLDNRGLQSTWSDGECDADTCFSGACRVRVLELYGVFISPSALVFTTNLTFLSLDSHLAISGAYTIDEMIGVLKCTPLLRTLNLRYWISDSRGGDPDDIAHLPELMTLEFFSHTLLQCALFTQRLSLPRTSAVALYCTCETLSEAVSPLSSFPRLSGGISDPRDFLEFMLNFDGSEIFIHASPYIIYPGGDLMLSPGCLTLRIGMHRTHHLDTDGIIQLLDLLDMRAVSYLSLGLGVHASIAWSPILSFFDMVSDIHLRACSWQSFVQGLSIAVPYELFGEEDDTPRLHGVQGLCLLCPYLRKLQLYHPLNSPGFTIDPLFFESLAIVLELRRASGVEVQVQLQSKQFSIAELRNIKALKRKAVWKYVKPSSDLDLF